MMNPIIFIAKGERLAFTFVKIFEAIFFVPPFSSKKTPMVVPKAMINPILDKVLPKPSVMVLKIYFASNPRKTPVSNEAMMRENKG